MKSLCGDKYGCLSHVDNAIGSVINWNGDWPCGRCMDIAIPFLEFAIGEPISWVVDGWVPKRLVMEKLESMILWQALKPEMEKLCRLSDVK